MTSAESSGDNPLSDPEHWLKLNAVRATETARNHAAVEAMETLRVVAEANADNAILGGVARMQVDKLKPLDDAYAAAEDAVDALWARGETTETKEKS